MLLCPVGNQVSIRLSSFYDLFYEEKIIEVKVLLWLSRHVGKCCECVPEWLDCVPLWLPERTRIRWNPGSGSCAFGNSFTAYLLRAPTSVNTHWLCLCSRARCTSARQLESWDQWCLAVMKEFTYDWLRITQCYLYQQSHNPKKRLLFPSR